MILKPWDLDHFHVHQTDPQFLDTLLAQHQACYWLAIVGGLTFQLGLPFTHESVRALWDAEQRDGNLDVRADAYIESYQGVIEDVVGKGHAIYAGKRALDADFGLDEMELSIYNREGSSIYHCTLGNGKGIVIYDPWSAAGSLSVLNGHLVDRHAIRIL